MGGGGEVWVGLGDGWDLRRRKRSRCGGLRLRTDDR